MFIYWRKISHFQLNIHVRLFVCVFQFQRIFCICFAFDIIIVGICHLSSDCDGIRRVSTKLEFHHFITTTCKHGRARAPQYQANKLKSSRTTKVNTEKQNKTLFLVDLVSVKSKIFVHIQRERERKTQLWMWSELT